MINLVTLQENLENLGQNVSKQTFIFDLLAAYELPRSTISLLSKNPLKLSGIEDQIILKNKVLFHITTLKEDEHVAIDALQKDKNSYKFNPRFIIVTDFVTFLAVDTKTKETLDIKIGDIAKHYAFFLPWCGMEKSQYVSENLADVRAAYKMDKLYQSIVNDDPEYYKNHSSDLNIFLSRLLFCFFAEDTGIFEKKGIFTNTIDSTTQENGGDLNEFFLTLFDVLNNKDRSKFASHFLEFPYVNGGLFEKEIKLPLFTASSRKLIIESGKLDWSSINPDIFGSMIQAVVHPGQRENLGMHYTSIPNIMKVIEPLFLNNLYEELQSSNNDIKKLTKLRERVSKVKIFDPACGSGNFLIVSYKELCKLEIKILHILNSNNWASMLSGETGFAMTTQSSVTLNNFFGIEIDDFASQIARLSLYLAQHQVNLEFEKEFGKLKPILPLQESGKIECSNAIRIDWESVCPKAEYGMDGQTVIKEYEIYIAGNPPYLGSRNQEDEQKEDLKSLFVSDYKSLDYISAWFFKGSKYISGYGDIKLAFVSTNSISQGEQVSLLWPRILNEGVEIFFAHQSFKWTNLAKGNAGVTCVIIGLANPTKTPKRLYFNNQYINCKNINPYLADGNNLIIDSRTKLLSEQLPRVITGNRALDGGNLMFNNEERNDIIERHPETEKFFKRVLGADEFINNVVRWCLWIDADQLSEIQNIEEFQTRINLVRRYREDRRKKDVNDPADYPYKFLSSDRAERDLIFIPQLSSERREYIPVGFLGNEWIVIDPHFVIYDPEPYIFAVLNSKMHMVWIRSVGGKLEDRLRYSTALCYNTFPFPNISPKQKESLTAHVYNILDEREKYPDKTMADLYDPDKMPDGLREAHKYLDLAIDQIYRSKPFENDEDRLAHLFKLYEEMIIKKTNE